MVKKSCLHGGCRVLLDVKDRNNRCEKHRKKSNADYNRQVRWSADKELTEFYQSRAWKKLRREIFSEQVICQMCLEEERIVIADVAHHIAPVRDFWELRLVRSNLICLCHKHHAEVHSIEYFGEYIKRKMNNV